MGYRAANAQLLTVPVHVIGCLLVFATGWYSDRIGKRYPSLLFGQGMVLLGLIFVFAFPIDPKYIGPRYLGCIFISAGGKLCYPGNLAWVSNNAESNGKRHIALAVTCTMGSLSTVVGTNVYLGREAPRYATGLSLSIVSSLHVTYCLCRIGGANGTGLDYLWSDRYTRPAPSADQGQSQAGRAGRRPC